MKKLCLLAICLMFAVPASAQNLLVNGDLESAAEPPWIRWQAGWSTGPSWLVGPPGYLSANGMHLDELTNNGSFGFYQTAVVPSGHTVNLTAMWEGDLSGAPNGWVEVMLFSVPVGTSGASIVTQIDTGAAGDIAFKRDTWGQNTPPLIWSWEPASLAPATGGNAGAVVSQGWVVVATKCGNGAVIHYDDFVLTDATPGAGKNPVTVDAGGTGDYLTIQAAISSFAQGGANSGMTPPFVINVVPGTYDEMLTLMDTDVGLGDIQGDIVIQSSVPGTRPVIKLQKNPATVHGLEIRTNSYNVTFNDLLFCPSMTGTLATTSMIHVDQTATDAVYDVLTFSNCLFTQIDGAGNPLVTTRTAAYTAGIVQTSPVPITYFLYFYPDAGEPKDLTLEECTFYGAYGGGSVAGSNLTGTHARVYVETDGDVFTVNNCVFAYSGNYMLALDGNGAGTMNMTGTDVTAGPDFCTYFVNQWEVDDHFIYWISSNNWIGNISNTMCRVIGPELVTATGTQGPRIIASYGSEIHLSDMIIENIAAGGSHNAYCSIINTVAENESWDRVTLHSTPPMYINSGTSVATLTVRDTIFSGLAQVWNSTGATIDVDYSAYVEAGADAISSRGTGQTDGANVVGGASSDPSYKSKDSLNEDYFDVSNSYYGGKGTAGSDLSGGADYDPPFVEEWVSY